MLAKIEEIPNLDYMYFFFFFLAGGFHFLITLFFSVTDLVTGLQQYSDVFPSVVNL